MPVNPAGAACRCGVDRLLGDRGRRGRPAARWPAIRRAAAAARSTPSCARRRRARRPPSPRSTRSAAGSGSGWPGWSTSSTRGSSSSAACSAGSIRSWPRRSRRELDRRALAAPRRARPVVPARARRWTPAAGRRRAGLRAAPGRSGGLDRRRVRSTSALRDAREHARERSRQRARDVISRIRPAMEGGSLARNAGFQTASHGSHEEEERECRSIADWRRSWPVRDRLRRVFEHAAPQRRERAPRRRRRSRAGAGAAGCKVGVSWNNYQKSAGPSGMSRPSRRPRGRRRRVHLERREVVSAATAGDQHRPAHLAGRQGPDRPGPGRDGRSSRPSRRPSRQGIPVIAYDRLIEDPKRPLHHVRQQGCRQAAGRGGDQGRAEGQLRDHQGQQGRRQRGLPPLGHERGRSGDAVDTGDIKIVGETYTDDWKPAMPRPRWSSS